jgi:hypothetical protein
VSLLFHNLNRKEGKKEVNKDGKSKSEKGGEKRIKRVRA